MSAEIVTSWAKEILSVALLYPLLWWQLKTSQKNIDRMFEDNREWFSKMWKQIDEWFDKFLTMFKIHATEDNDNFKSIQREISRAVWKTKLTNEQIIEIAKARVWLTSEKKLDFIKKRLEKNNLKARKEIIQKQIRTELERRSEEYIVFLNQFTTPVWLLWDWISDNFPMDNFMNELFDVIFRDDNEWHTLTKLEDCRFIMSAYQNELWQKLKSKLIF